MADPFSLPSTGPSPVSAPTTHDQVCLAALAADAPLPWRIEDGIAAAPTVIVDRENAYVCETDPREFAVPDDDGTEQARRVADLILAAVARPDRTATSIADDLIARDARPLENPRVELADYVMALSLLASEAVALRDLDVDAFRRRAADSLYRAIRVTRALGIDIDPALAGLIATGNADYARSVPARRRTAPDARIAAE